MANSNSFSSRNEIRRELKKTNLGKNCKQASVFQSSKLYCITFWSLAVKLVLFHPVWYLVLVFVLAYPTVNDHLSWEKGMVGSVGWGLVVWLVFLLYV